MSASFVSEDEVTHPLSFSSSAVVLPSSSSSGNLPTCFGESITPKTTFSFERYLTASVWDNSRGLAYVFGGVASRTLFDQILKYNPVSDSISLSPRQLITPRYGIASAWDPVNKIAYLIGGKDSSSATAAPLPDIFTYDPASESLTPKPSLPFSVFGASAVYFNNKVYIFGGYNGSYINLVLVYDIATNTVNFVTDGGGTPITFPSGRFGSTATLDPTTNLIYIFFGYNGAPLNDIFVFNPSNNSLSPVTLSAGSVPVSPRYIASSF